ncbi:GIY-YIG nuclease family protein [Maribacter ulvicola]
MSFTTYIIYSQTLDRYYIGSTEDIKERLKRQMIGL